MLQNKPSDVIGIASCYVEQEVIGTAQYKDLRYLRKLSKLFPKSGHQVPRPRAESDTDQSLQRHPQRFGIHINSEPLNHPCLFEGSETQ